MNIEFCVVVNSITVPDRFDTVSNGFDKHWLLITQCISIDEALTELVRFSDFAVRSSWANSTNGLVKEQRLAGVFNLRNSAANIEGL